MRPNHKNNRMRGRHRKQSNPLTRSYESNGPDIKVRGTPQHIVEKYAQLARDAQVSGDPVLAEAYLQHAEHYFRIISAAQQEMARAQGFGRPGEGPEADEADDDGDDDGYANGQLYPTLRPPQHQQGGFQRQADPGEQPQPDGQPFVPRERPQYDRQDRGDRGDRQDGRQDNRQDRGDRPERVNFDRSEGGEPRGDRPDRGDRQDRNDRQGRNRFQRNRGEFRDRRPPQGDAGEAVDASLPAFITGGAPRPAPVEGNEPAVEAAPAFEGDNGAGEARHPFRQRRRRRFGAEGDAPESASDAPRGEAVE